MQMFTVPQFIDVEDKIIGSITVRQFIIILAGFVVAGIGYKIFDFSLFIAWAVLCLLIVSVLAFARINGRPFHFFILNIVQTSKKPKLRVWNHKNTTKNALLSEEDGREVQAQAREIPAKPRLAGSRLRELSLIVDTKGVYKGGEEEDLVE
ncbi:MAG: PrgI family protein [Patescibacteria group bacterium]